jgi:uncharacterized membrane protein YGL010W
MRTVDQQLGRYAEYHRDPRNIATHFAGVPMILFAVVILLSRPVLFHAGVPVTAALLAALAAGTYYLRLHRPTGLLMAVVLVAMLYLAHRIAGMPTAIWLGWGLGLFVAGWIIQAVGHVFEGRKPAFMDDLMGLVIGPHFVLCEALFAFGFFPELKAAIERVAGPTRRRPAGAAA